jgi:hypothetical protein
MKMVKSLLLDKRSCVAEGDVPIEPILEMTPKYILLAVHPFDG